MQPRQEATKFWHDTTLNNLELLRATYVTHTFAPHVHEGYAIGVIDAGAEVFRYRGANHVAVAGSLQALTERVGSAMVRITVEQPVLDSRPGS
ncbi:MAG: AraC family ligand binding domain-containing protein [Caldilineaceae bacterium]|nr:AraC family ligand binding domain-containing protein [Caldilineaceae bacterium]